MLQKIYETYNYAMDKGADPRVKGYYLMSSPLPTLLIVAVYVIGVTKIGPKLMENRKPYEIKNVLIFYNAVQVILSSYLFYINGSAGWFKNYTIFKCQNVNYSTTDPQALLGVYACYMYFISKFTEFFDTIFFVLRKKNSQITFLHLFHHTHVPIFAWICVKFIPGGGVTMGMCCNSLVHMIMYSYYLLAGLGPHMQKYLWWKKYLTTLQLVQFVVAMFHLIIVMLGDCESFYKPLVIIGFIYIFALYYLFKRFYDNSYKKQEKDK